MYELLLIAHVIGACVLIGTGAGIAFFMVMAQRGHDPVVIAHTARVVVIADTLFTATAAVAQPLTGYGLARISGWSMTEGWVQAAIVLYVVIGVFWLPVVWIQIRLRDLAVAARDAGTALPGAYYRLYRVWFACGFPAFAAIIGIVWLMVVKPVF